jgi:hypothetical protein
MFLRRGGGAAVSQSGQNIRPAVSQSGQNIRPAVSQSGQNILQPTPEQHGQQSFNDSGVSSTQHLDEKPPLALPPIIHALLPVISSGGGLQVSTMTMMAKRGVHVLNVVLSLMMMGLVMMLAVMMMVA